MKESSEALLKLLQSTPKEIMESAPANIKLAWDAAQLLKMLKKESEETTEDKINTKPTRALFPKEIKTIQEHCMKILLDARVPENTVEVRLDGIKLEMRRPRNDDDDAS